MEFAVNRAGGEGFAPVAAPHHFCSGGKFTDYFDANPTNFGQRFYRLRWDS